MIPAYFHFLNSNKPSATPIAIFAPLLIMLIDAVPAIITITEQFPYGKKAPLHYCFLAYIILY